MSSQIEERKFGPTLVVTGEWEGSDVELYEQSGLGSIELNRAKGWKGRDVEFLRSLDGLTSLVVIDHGLKDDSWVQQLSSLRDLDLNTYCQNEIDFSAFPNLQRVVLEWRKKFRNLFQIKSIEELFINKYRADTLDAPFSLPKLRVLTVKSPSIQALGAAPPAGLSRLWIAMARKLVDVSGLERMDNLSFLSLQTCNRLSQIDPCSYLKALEVLHLNENSKLESLAPVLHCKSLHELLFYGGTNIVDGKICQLLSLPLREIAYQNRRHYDVKAEEMRRLIAER